MTATQAPTPGPLSVGTPAIRSAIALFRSAIKSGEAWSEDCAIAYRSALAELDQLAVYQTPTAPVEASGSERIVEAVEAMAEAWSDRVEIQRMVETTSAVFAKWASPELLSRFRQQMMAVIQQAYIEGVGARVEVVRAHSSPPPAADEDRVRETPGAAEAFDAIDVADRLIERAYGDEVPTEWTKTIKGVAKARSALKSTAAKEGEK